MPSGHATAAFATAAALSAEYSRAPAHSRIVAPLLYTGATLVGLSRIYHDKHWASDIVVSAGLGTLCGAKVVQYHHTHPGNRLDRWLLSASLVPYERGAAVVLPLDSR
jgi:membrane-associated phospholipid phosphatase